MWDLYRLRNSEDKISEDKISIIKFNIFLFRPFIFLFHEQFNLSTALW